MGITVGKAAVHLVRLMKGEKHSCLARGKKSNKKLTKEAWEKLVSQKLLNWQANQIKNSTTLGKIKKKEKKKRKE